VLQHQHAQHDLGRRAVKSIAYVHTADIDPTVVKSGATLEGLANICVTAAEKALEAPPKGYTPTQRNSLTDTFASMKVTHRSIRVLVALGDEKPESVDALVLARLQLEGLYTLCLLTEQPEHVHRFVKEAWKRQYIRYLLMREETKGLDRFIEAQNDVHELSRLLKLATVWNVTEAERLTIEYDELETVPAAGFVREPIRNFPTPGGVIKELPPGPKRAMLERLYIDYQDLCAYAHGRPIAGFNKTVFDVRSPLRNMFPIAEIHKTFEQRIEADCQVDSLMSIAQSAAELTTLYPNDVELASAVTRTWNELHNAHMLANAVWNIRTKGLFGVVG
jgi:hypothetical protein